MRIEIRPLVLILLLFSLPVLLMAQDDIPGSRHNIKPGKSRNGAGGKTSAKTANKASTGHGSSHHGQPVAREPIPKPGENIAFIPSNRHRINPRDGAEEIYIPAGWFWMGDKDLPDNPRRAVYLSGFWIYKYPVTGAQFRKFCRATNYDSTWLQQKDDHPVVMVSWEVAADYSSWAFGDGEKVYLPTEAQWEKAARGTDARAYPWGNEWDSGKCANSVLPNSLKSSVPVKEYANGASPYGVYHMAGNIAQWCADWYNADYYKTAPSQNPSGPSSGKDGLHSVRGSAYDDKDPKEYRVSLRGYGDHLAGGESAGFRCASTR